MDKVLHYLDTHEAEHLNELLTLLRFASVSSKPERKGDTRACAQWLVDHLAGLGFTARLEETPFQPIVYAEHCKKPGKPTLLIYGHYDVQPEEPLELWKTPPFEPTIVGCKIYGRGTADDKGQLFAHIKAAEALIKATGELPLNIKLIFEGEEEVGSESLEAYLPLHKDELACDAIVISDSPMYQKGIPTLTLGLRGLAYFQIDVTSAGTDLHSGSFGGAVPNAANAACEIVSRLKSPEGRVLIPGFYDKVRPLSPEEKESFAGLPFDEEAFKKQIGLTAITGEEGYGVLERLSARPTLDVNGLLAGYTGEGAKTVIPAKAMIKVSTRLVPDQDPEEVARLFTDYVKQIAPKGVAVGVQYFHGGRAYVADPQHPAFVTARAALEEGFGEKAAYNREGGSIPIVNVMTALLGAPCLLMGLGLPDENAHAPNEYFDLDNWRGGMRTFAIFYERFANAVK